MYGQKIRSCRKALHLTQENLAMKIGVVRTTVIAWEMEKYPPTNCWNIAALEDALGLERGELYAAVLSHQKK